jgi:hypothetical protein
MGPAGGGPVFEEERKRRGKTHHTKTSGHIGTKTKISDIKSVCPIDGLKVSRC